MHLASYPSPRDTSSDTYCALHPLLRHFVPGSTGIERSSCSNGSGFFSSTAGVDTRGTVVASRWTEPYTSVPPSTEVGPARVALLGTDVLTGVGRETFSLE